MAEAIQWYGADGYNNGEEVRSVAHCSRGVARCPKNKFKKRQGGQSVPGSEVKADRTVNGTVMDGRELALPKDSVTYAIDLVRGWWRKMGLHALPSSRVQEFGLAEAAQRYGMEGDLNAIQIRTIVTGDLDARNRLIQTLRSQQDNRGD